MTEITDRVQRDANHGLNALLSWAFETIHQTADEHEDMFDEPHPAQAWLDCTASDDAPTWVAGRHRDTGNQSMSWLTSDGHEVTCELVWTVHPPEAP